MQLFVYLVLLVGITSTRSNDRIALEIFYNATDGANWNYKWDLASDLCYQPGVVCVNSYVSRLNLYFNSLRGSLPTEIGMITTLTELNLNVNSLTGSLPTHIGFLTSLTDLTLGTNLLTGNMPTEIGLMTTLTSLDLAGNSLTGSLPTDIGLVTSLTFLNLNFNSLTGSLTTEIGLMTSLDIFNSLTGSLPTHIGFLTSLTGFDLGSNSLTGSIPTEIGSMTSITELYLHSNSLTRSVATEIGLMTSLKTLFLHSNSLTGNLPSEIGLLTSLMYLYLYSNSLTGSLPTEIGLLTSLIELYMHSNSLTGSLPTEIGLMTSLVRVSLEANNFSCPLVYFPDTVTEIDDVVNEMDCGAYGVWKTFFLKCEFNGTRTGAEVFCSYDGNATIDESNCESSPKPNLVTVCVGDWKVSDWGSCIGGSQKRTVQCKSRDDDRIMNKTTCLLQLPTLEQNCYLFGLSRDMIIVLGVSASVFCLVMLILFYKYKQYKKLQRKKNIIQFKDLSELAQLSEGHFGMVYSAVWNSPKGAIDVVCKTPKLDPSKNDWLESMILNKVKPHENIISLCGICLDFKEPLSQTEGICIVVPFYAEGSLNNYLLNIDKPLSHEQRCSLALGMTKGLQHMHNSGFLHRDVAARNYLLNSDLNDTILTDFGLSRPISEDGEYKFVGSHELPAINAPETLSRYISTTKSDVWQLGVAFWWLHAAGRTRDMTPFSKIDHHLFLSTLKTCHNSSVPLEFFDSSEFATLIKICCSYYYKDRPTTEHIILELTALLADPQYKIRAYVGVNIREADDIAQHWPDSSGVDGLAAHGKSSVRKFDPYQLSAPGCINKPNP